LVRWLDDGSNIFVLCFDSKSVTREALDQLRSDLPHDRCFFVGMPIVWAGSSQVASSLSAIEIALDKDKSWSHFINLSESDIPLRPLAELKARLDASGPAHSVIFYFDRYSKFDPKPVDPDHEIIGMDYFGRQDRPRFQIQRSALPLFKAIIDSGFGRNDLRAQLRIEEDSTENRLRIRSLTTDDIGRRKALFAKYPYGFGRQWVCLHRSFCEWLFASGAAPELFDELKHVFIPDECFFQTASLASGKPLGSTIENGCLHAHEGSPMDIGPARLEELAASKKFFARKLTDDPQGESIVVDWVEARLSKEGIETDERAVA
jgi:hypothetical protein